MPLLMQFLGGSPEWSQYDTDSSGDPDRILENKKSGRKYMVTKIPSLTKQLSGKKLAKMLGNPNNRLTSKQKELLSTEGFKGFMSMKDSLSNLESYSNEQWDTFFTDLSMIHASTSLFISFFPRITGRVSPFAPKEIFQGSLISTLSMYAYFADSFQQYDRQLKDSFETVYKHTRKLHEKEIDRWLKPWRLKDLTELKTATNIDTSTSIEEV